MSHGERDRSIESQDATFVDERGVILSRSGMARAGERLAEARARHTPEYFAVLRDHLGIPPRTA